jgi:hypothetical protein
MREELHDLYSLPNIIQMIRSRTAWEKHVIEREEGGIQGVGEET